MQKRATYLELNTQDGGEALNTQLLACSVSRVAAGPASVLLRRELLRARKSALKPSGQRPYFFLSEENSPRQAIRQRIGTRRQAHFGASSQVQAQVEERVGRARYVAAASTADLRA